MTTRQSLQEISQGVTVLSDKIDAFLAGVRNLNAPGTRSSEFEDNLRPRLRLFIGALIIDAPPENCKSLYDLIVWNVAQDRIPKEFLSCPEFIDQIDFIKNQFMNSNLGEAVCRVRIFDRKSPWDKIIRQVGFRLPDQQDTIFSLFCNSVR